MHNLVRDVKVNDAQVVLLIQPEMHDLLSEYLAIPDGPARVPVIAIGSRGAKPVSDRITLGGLAGYLPMQDLDQLPLLVKRVLTKLPEAREQGIDLSTDSLRECQKMISIGRLTAEIAHEINNPLESVGNLLYLAQAEPNLTEKASDYLHSAERELARVVQISKQTLSFYRESNQPTSIRMADLMEEVVDLYSRRIHNKKINVEREYASVQGLNALPGEIRQVLSNLVTNAIEASAQGGKLRLRIRSGHKFTDGQKIEGLRITVADTGSGIPEAARKRLGELFFTTKGQAGTGLGLWVTRSIVNRYGGTIFLKSCTGPTHGTVFHIFLPFERPMPLRRERKVVNGSSFDRVTNRRANLRQISDHPAHFDNKSVSRQGNVQGRTLVNGHSLERSQEKARG
jgi:two-component system NtrC family sensor kinase